MPGETQIPEGEHSSPNKLTKLEIFLKAQSYLWQKRMQVAQEVMLLQTELLELLSEIEIISKDPPSIKKNEQICEMLSDCKGIISRYYGLVCHLLHRP